MLCYEYPPVGGGGAKVVDGLTHELSKKGYEVHLVTMRFNNLPAFEKMENLCVHRIKCIRLKKSICTFPEMITYILSGFFYTIRLHKIHKFNLNHTHFIFPDGIIAYLLFKITGLKYIVTAHGSDIPGYNPNRFKLLHKVLKPLWNLIVKNSGEMIFPSKSLLELFRAADQKTKAIIIPNGIDLNKFSPFVEKQNKILVVTRMFERKGVQFVLRALEGIEHDYQINIVGEGPYLKSLKKIASESRLDVNFLGFVDNTSEHLKMLFEESMIFIFTSSSENFPIVLLEAMIAGMAIITSKGTGCEEVVGDSALLVRINNSDDIRIALERLINNPQLIKNLQLASRKRVEELYGWNENADKYINLYKIHSRRS